MKKNKGFKGRIKLRPIEFSEIYEFEVKKANDTSGRIYLPSKLIGKRVYVLVNEEKGSKK